MEMEKGREKNSVDQGLMTNNIYFTHSLTVLHPVSNTAPVSHAVGPNWPQRDPCIKGQKCIIHGCGFTVLVLV